PAPTLPASPGPATTNTYRRFNPAPDPDPDPDPNPDPPPDPNPKLAPRPRPTPRTPPRPLHPCVIRVLTTENPDNPTVGPRNDPRATPASEPSSGWAGR